MTDASLLTITGFPAFAVGDESLCQQAKAMVVEKLEVGVRKEIVVERDFILGSITPAVLALIGYAILRLRNIHNDYKLKNIQKITQSCS